MAIVVKDNGGGDFERPEVGLHQAVCSHVADLGIQPTNFGDKRQVAICWELDQKMKDDRPFMQSKIYTSSLNEKSNLRHDLESWRGQVFSEQELEGFDLEVLVGKNCMLNLAERPSGDRVYININAVLPTLKNTQAIKPYGNPLPEWIQKRINVPASGNGWDDAPAAPPAPAATPAPTAPAAVAAPAPVEKEDLPF